MQKNKTIVFINQYYTPIQNPPAKRISAFANHLANKGWNVKIITGMPNYPTGKINKKYQFKLYDKEKKRKNLTIHRFFEIPLKLEGFWKPFVNYLSFAISSLFGANIIRKSNLIYISAPPTFSSITTFYLAKLFKKKIIFEVRDLYPETAEELGLINKKNLSYKIFKKINQHMFSKSNQIITIGTKLSQEIKKKYAITNIKIITNFATRKKISETKNEKIEIAYTGVITDAQELEKILKLNKNKKIREKFNFQIVGTGNRFNKIKELIKKNKYTNIKLHGYKSKEYCDNILKQSDIGLITLANKKIFQSALPSKFFEYISLGKPIISNQSKQLKELIEKNDCGWFLEKENEEKILTSINREEIQSKAKKAKRIFTEQFEKEAVCKQMQTICENIIK